MQKPLLKLHLIFAPKAPVAAILRQGPAKYVRLFHWDRRDNRSVDGQWIKDKIAIPSCALSPDGRHLGYAVKDCRPDARYRDYWVVCQNAPLPQKGPSAMGDQRASVRFVLADPELDLDQNYHTFARNSYRRAAKGALDLIGDVLAMECESIAAPYAAKDALRRTADIAP